MLLRQLEKELVRYCIIKNNQLRHLYEIAKSDTIERGCVKLIIQAMHHMKYSYTGDPECEYDEHEVNFINVTIVPNVSLPGRPKIITDKMHLIALYFYINIDAKCVVSIETCAGILPRKPEFQEILDYFINCLGFRVNDFRYVLEKLKLLNVMAV